MGEHQVSHCALHSTHANSIVFSAFYHSAISHDPELFDSPELFEPERFLGERGKHPRLADFDLPFGFGRRICPGRAVAEQALFIVISRCVSVLPSIFLLGVMVAQRHMLMRSCVHSMLWAFDFSPARDEKGQALWPDPQAATSNVTRRPAVFPCALKPRSEEIGAMIREEAARAEEALREWE